MRDLTRTSGWRNTRARVDREPNSTQKTINKELMYYIQTLENQIILLEKKIVAMEMGWANSPLEGINKAREAIEANCAAVPFRLYARSDIEERIFKEVCPGIEVVRVDQVMKGEENDTKNS